MPRFSAFVDLGNYAGTTFTGFSGGGLLDYHIQGINIGDDGYNTNTVIFTNAPGGVVWSAVNGIALVRSDFSIIGGWRFPKPYLFTTAQMFVIPARGINVSIGNTATVAAGQVAGSVGMSGLGAALPFIAGASYNTQPWY